MVVVAEPMQAFAISMAVMVALLAVGGFYSLHRVRQLDRELAERDRLAKGK